MAAIGLETVTDPSNFEARFRRNRVRHEVMPLLAEVAGRDPVPLMARTAGLLAEDADFLDLLASSIDPTDARAPASRRPRPWPNGLFARGCVKGKARNATRPRLRSCRGYGRS